MLERVAEDVWTLARPQSFLGLQLGTRMTVVRLSDASLFVHSPVALDEALRREIDALGTVRHIVAPNLYHHLHAGPFAAAYPGARLHGAPGLDKKRKDLPLTALLSDEPDPGWRRDLRQALVRGSMFHETVFLHERSGTLIVTDLIEGFSHCDPWTTRAFLRMTGVYGRTTVARQHRLAYRDKPAARGVLARVLAWDIARIVPCHGDLIFDDAAATLRDSFAFLSIKA